MQGKQEEVEGGSSAAACKSINLSTLSLQGKSGFLKGLIVIDEVAYFGKCPPMERQGRDGQNVNCDIVAVDLIHQKLLFVHKVATHGLLNIISAPHLSIASTYTAQYMSMAPTREPGKLGDGASKVRVADLIRAEEVEKIDDNVAAVSRWSSTWLQQQLNSDDIAGAFLCSTNAFARSHGWRLLSTVLCACAALQCAHVL
jgi:hypothetical protein